MDFPSADTKARLAAGDFEDLDRHRKKADKLGPASTREVEVAYAKGCLDRVRKNASAPFWDDLGRLIESYAITLEELGTDQREMRRLRRTVDVASARWALGCFRGSLIQMHRRNLARIMGTRGVRYADIGTTRDEVLELELRAKAS